MDVTAIARITQAVPTAGPPVDLVAPTRDVVQAIKALNQSEMFGENELQFQRDQSTRRLVIRIVNRNTKEVISQVPPEYVLRLADDLKK